jgi:hypothetical protein
MRAEATMRISCVVVCNQLKFIEETLLSVVRRAPAR